MSLFGDYYYKILEREGGRYLALVCGADVSAETLNYTLKDIFKPPKKPKKPKNINKIASNDDELFQL